MGFDNLYPCEDDDRADTSIHIKSEEDYKDRCDISRLYEIFSELSPHIEPSELIKTAQKTIIEMLGTDAAAIYLYNEDKSSLSINYLAGLSDEYYSSLKSLSTIDDLTGVILKTKSPLFLNAEDYPKTGYKYLFNKENIKSIWIFPIISLGKVLGLLGLGMKSDIYPNGKEQQYIEVLCNQLGILIHNSLLYDGMRKELEEKNKLQEELLKAKHETEKARKIAEQNWLQLDLILKNVEAIVWQIDSNGIYTRFEGKSLSKFGLKSEMIVGRSIFDLLKDWPICVKAANSALLGNSCRFEENVNDWVFDVKYSPIFDNEGIVYGAVGIANDITEIKKMHRKLSENETRYKMASEIARIASYDWNIEDRRIIVDEMWAKTLGYEPWEISEISTDAYNELTHPEDLEKQNELIEKHFSGETDYYECEVRMKKKNGEWVWLLDRGKLIERTEDNKPLRAVGAHIDITQRKKAEEFESILREKEREESLKNEFFANISHELRTPVNVIYSAIQLESNYVSNLDVNQIIKYHKTIKQNCLRLIRLINNIIDITRIEAGFFKPEFKVQNIVSLVENAALPVISYAELKHINVIFDTEGEEIYMKCDSNFIDRIILNLLSNAVKYGREYGSIEVNINKKGEERVIIAVKDDGIGIPEELQKNVFERFQRVDKSMSRSTEGSGIGLSLAKSLVEIQSGTITLNSKINEGTEFLIEFPVSEEYEELCVTEKSYENHGESQIIEKVNIEFSDIYM